MSNTVPEGAENLLKIDLSFFSRSSFVDDCVGAIARCSVRGEMGDVRLKLGVRVVGGLVDETKARTLNDSLHLGTEKGVLQKLGWLWAITIANQKVTGLPLLPRAPLYPGCPCRHMPVRLPMIYTHKPIVWTCPYDYRCKVTNEKKMGAPV
jgi:hypothetical protein